MEQDVGIIANHVHRSSPAGARHKCREGRLRVNTERLANRDDVIRRLHANQRSSIGIGRSAFSDSEVCSCVLYPHLEQGGALPLFMAVVIPGVTNTDCLDFFPDLESKAQSDKTPKKPAVHQSQDVEIDYIILSFGPDLNSTSDAAVSDVSKSEEQFLHQVSNLANAAAAAEVGHALWLRACDACSPQRRGQPLASDEMTRLISHLKEEYFVPVRELDPERLQPLLALPASWSQVVFDCFV